MSNIHARPEYNFTPDETPSRPVSVSSATALKKEAQGIVRQSYYLHMISVVCWSVAAVGGLIAIIGLLAIGAQSNRYGVDDNTGAIVALYCGLAVLSWAGLLGLVRAAIAAVVVAIARKRAV